MMVFSGRANPELAGQIAAKLGRSVRTVARKLQLIRGLWAEEGRV